MGAKLHELCTANAMFREGRAKSIRWTPDKAKLRAARRPTYNAGPAYHVPSPAPRSGATNLPNWSLALRTFDLRRRSLVLLAAVCFAWVLAPVCQLLAGDRLLVVAPAELEGSLEKFLAYKNTLLKTEFKSLESILAESQGVDDPEKLKRYFYEQWKSADLGYVLLVGDVDVMPVRYIVTDRKTKSAFNYAFYPSDLYYSDLAKPDGEFDDWNAQKEGFHATYFGEVRGAANKDDGINFDNVDYRPDVAVGRWPVSKPDDVATVAAKSMEYERRAIEGADSRQRRASLVSVGGWVDTRVYMNRLKNKLKDNWEVERTFYADKRRTYDVPEPSRKQVRSIFDSGAGLVLHAGHGQPWGWEKCFFPKDLERLAESDAMPVVYSASCSTAHFAPLPPYGKYIDIHGAEHAGTSKGEVFTSPPPAPAAYQPGDYNRGCIAEKLLAKPGAGAVAYIGCNTGSQPCGLTLMRGFVDKLADDAEPRLGDCWSHAVAYYYDHEKLATIEPTDSWYPPTIFFQSMKFMCFGDPSLRMPGEANGSVEVATPSVN